MRKGMIAATALVAGLFVDAGPAAAQAWIGAMVGEMAARQAEAQREEACRKGVPASEKVQAWALSTSDAAMAAYSQLSPKSKPSSLGKVFAMSKPDVRWKGHDGVVPINEVPARLGAISPALERTAFVVAGDGTSARGIWKATWSDQPGRVAWFAVDLVGNAGGTIWGGGGYRIWHFTQFEGGDSPAAPAAYCHYDPDQAW